MHTLIRVFLALLFTAFSLGAYANCSSIRDNDQRAYCYATTGSGSCGNIRDSDLRNRCYAETR